jgi:hypothetical protein
VSQRRSVYFGRNQARPAASARSLLPVGEHARRRDRAGIGRKTPTFYGAPASDTMGFAPAFVWRSRHVQKGSL